MNRLIIDGNTIHSREEFFETLRTQLGESRLTGSNLDALYDALTSITQHTVIEVKNKPQLENSLGEYWQKITWVLNDCLEENRDLKLEEN